MSGQTFHWTNLAFAFVLELCALVALGYWGARTGGGPLTKAALGLAAPLLAAVLWGTFAAPKAPVIIPFVGLGVKLVVFGSAATVLYATGHRTLALTFAVLVFANGVMLQFRTAP